MGKVGDVIGLWKCSSCANMNEYYMSRCTKCDQRRPHNWNCLACNNTNSDLTVNCTNCGADHPLMPLAKRPQLEAAVANPADFEYAKLFLIALSIATGLLFSYLFWNFLGFFSILFGVGVSLGYTFLAAFAVRICEALRDWAYVNEIDSWSQEERVWAGALWPISLLCCLVLYIFLGIIHRVF